LGYVAVFIGLTGALGLTALVAVVRQYEPKFIMLFMMCLVALFQGIAMLRAPRMKQVLSVKLKPWATEIHSGKEP